MPVSVSVVIPAYNAGEFIACCLDSVIAQDYRPEEIICVDDCSSDDTVSIIQSYCEKYPGWVRLIRMEKNAGAPKARNAALQLVKSDYVQLLDADDFLLPGKLRHQAALITADVDFIAGATYRRTVSGTDRLIDVKEGDPWLALLSGGIGCTCSNLWKMSAIRAAGGFNEKLKSSQEYGLMLALLRNKAKVTWDHTPLTVVRDQLLGMSVSRKNPLRNLQQFILLRGETVQFLQEHSLLPSAAADRYFQPLFEAIRGLYQVSPQRALVLYRRYIPVRFRPQPSAAITAAYCRMFRVFGFSLTEKIRSFYRRFKKTKAADPSQLHYKR